jgi:hypothetical protein
VSAPVAITGAIDVVKMNDGAVLRTQSMIDLVDVTKPPSVPNALPSVPEMMVARPRWPTSSSTPAPCSP